MNGDFNDIRFHAQDGTGIYVREYGQRIAHRPTILCLTGLARNSRDYHKTALRLEGIGLHVLALDYRGRGRSDYCADPESYTPATYLDDIRHLLTLEDIHQVIVLGTSLGGLLAMGMGAAMPACLKGVILNDVGPDVKPEGMARIIAYLSQSPRFKNWEEATDHFKILFSQVNYNNEDDWLYLTKNSCREENGTIRYDWDPNIVVPLKKGAPLPDLWALFRALNHVPMLAFRGEISDILTEETFAHMAQSHDTVRCVTVPGVGHVPSLEEPVCLEALDEFLSPFL